MTGVTVKLESVTKYYGKVRALENVSLEIPSGSLFTILGPSGCGKSTLLGIIAGLIPPSKGRVFFDGDDVTLAPPQKRRIGMVFQDLALFPHMTVYDNIAFGLAVKKVSEAEIRRKVREVMELVRLDYEEYARRMPHQLSGGQQQRVALARALAVEPRVLLLDEPLSHVDYNIKQELLDELKRVQKETGVTTLYVTHDQSEAMYLADWLAVMREGRVEQVGRPEEVYDKPASEFVARFFGDINLFPLDALEKGHAEAKIGLRLEHTLLSKRPVAPGNGILGWVKGRIVEKVFQGPNVLFKIETEYGDAKSLVAREKAGEYQVGDTVYILIPRSRAIIFQKS